MIRSVFILVTSAAFTLGAVWLFVGTFVRPEIWDRREKLREDIVRVQQENEALRESLVRLESEVQGLKNRDDVTARAIRNRLGYIRDGELLFRRSTDSRAE